jgi:hypothetical protein
MLSLRRLDITVLVSWLLLLAIVVLLPRLSDSDNLGDDLTRYTVRLALVYYVLALNFMLVLDPTEWLATTTPRGRITRWFWTLAWITYLVHLGMAFHYYHHWSHAHAIEHTQEVSGFGNGIYFSHLFTLVWGADVLAWWLGPQAYAARSPRFGRCLHAFMLFIVFNATIVYEEGPIRWAGMALFAELAAVVALRRFLLAKTVQLG